MFGEVGLSGDVRPVARAELRLNEAKRLGFARAVIAKKNYLQLKDRYSGIEIYGVASVSEALKLVLPKV